MELTREKSLLVNLALMASSFLICLAGLEAVAWFWEQRQAQGPYAWELVASRRIWLDRIETPDGGYTLMHPGEAYTWQDISVRINSQGLRSPNVAPKKPPDIYRILNLGDSVVFGWGVRYEDTHGYRLQELLNDYYGSKQTKYEVINAGVPGWNMENILAYLKAEGLAYQPDLILLNVTLVNDVYGQSAVKPSGEPLLDWLRDHTYFWPFLSVQYHHLQMQMGRQKALPVLNPPSEATAYFPVQETDPQWDVVWEPIQTMAMLAHEHGAGFILIVLPTAFQVEDTGYSTIPQQILTRRAKEVGIETLDLLPNFRQVCLEVTPKEGCGPEDRYLWADMWMHPSTVGHRLMAERILEDLRENGEYLTKVGNINE